MWQTGHGQLERHLVLPIGKLDIGKHCGMFCDNRTPAHLLINVPSILQCGAGRQWRGRHDRHDTVSHAAHRIESSKTFLESEM